MQNALFTCLITSSSFDTLYFSLNKLHKFDVIGSRITIYSQQPAKNTNKDQWLKILCASS